MEIPDIPLDEDGDAFQTTMAILIAIVTLVGAVLAWRAAMAGSAAGDADFAGLNAVLNAEETLGLNNTAFHRHYRAYTRYTRYGELQDLLEEDAELDADGVRAQQHTEASNLATTNQLFFPARYLQRDGSYAVQRELGEAWAQAGQAMDLEPDPHFVEADQMRQKTNWLVAIFVALAFSLLFYALAEGLHPTRRVLRLVAAVGGSAFLILTVAAGIAVEMLL